MTPLPNPNEFLSYIADLTGDSGAKIDDFSVPDGMFRSLFWDIIWIDRAGVPCVYRLLVSSQQLERTAHPSEMIRDYLSELIQKNI